MSSQTGSATGIGAAVRRREGLRFDPRRGQCPDDDNRPVKPRALSVATPQANAKIRKVDAAPAKKMPGVVALLTGAELASDKTGNLICGWMIHSKDGAP